MHLLRKAIADGVGGEAWKPKLEELYKLAVGKLPKRMIATLVDVDGYNVHGDLVITPVTTPVITPVTVAPVAAPVTVAPVAAPATPVAAPATPVATPATPTTSTRYTFPQDPPDPTTEEFIEIPPNPFSSQVESPRASNNIVIVKGYEYHFIPSSLRGHLKIIRK